MIFKNEHRMDRNYLAGQQGDAVNALLATIGYNFSLLLKWLRQLLCLIAAVIGTFRLKQAIWSRHKREYALLVTNADAMGLVLYERLRIRPPHGYR